MSKVLTAGMNALFIAELFGTQGLAQVGLEPQHPDGKSLSSPEEQERANRSMNTPSGQMGNPLSIRLVPRAPLFSSFSY